MALTPSWPIHIIIIVIVCLMMMMMVLNLVNSSSLSSSSFKGGDKSSLRSALMNSGVELDVMYRYSHEFTSSVAPSVDGVDPEEMHMRWSELGLRNVKGGSKRFLERLLVHDHLRRRHLLDSTTSGTVSLSPTNRTSEYRGLGGLHYAIVTIGTPSKQFLVALDTGSDLLWIPCQCQECAIPDWSRYGVKGLPEFAIYNPEASNTSKTVRCGDAICVATLSSCVGVGACVYNVRYLSANTSTSGYIVQDVLKLNSEGSPGTSVQAPIYFGCGQVQTGLLLEVAPNGLFGLGPEVYSVPSALASNSIVPNQVFSMCFSEARTLGRLVFGSKPPTSSSTVSQTPLLPFTPSLFYVVRVASFTVDRSTVNVNLPAIFDTGTSITILNPSVVKAVGNTVSSKLGLQQVPVEIQQDFVLQYCWNPSDIQTELPPISIVFGGGKTWQILRPYLGLVDDSGNLLYICLSILEDPNYNIIGYNFMSGYEYFFDQGSMIFSWVPSNCSNAIGNTSQPLPSIDNINIPTSMSSPQASPTSTSSPSPPSQHSMSNAKYKISPIVIISSVLIWLVLPSLC